MRNRNLILTGDWHIQMDTPSSRIDDYKKTIENKTDQILNLCLENNADLVIPGDLFSKVATNNEFIVYFLKLFKKFKDNDVNVVTIFGNHDVFRTQYELEEKTPMKILEEAHLIEILRKGKTLEYNNLNVTGFGYYDEILPAKKNGKKSLAIIHKFFGQPSYRNYNMEEEELVELGYKYALFGHDHIAYDVSGSICKVIRPGALTRGTSHFYNFERGVFVYLFNTETLRYKEISLEVKPMTEVVRERKVNEVINKRNQSFITSFGDYTQRMEEIVRNENEDLQQVIERINKKTNYSEVSRNLLISNLS